MDRPEVPGDAGRDSTRRCSQRPHDDVRYRLWVPVSGKLKITIGSSKSVAAAAGQAFFIEKGTPHGFRSVGDTPAAVLEIFVKDGVSAAKIQALGVTPGALAKP